MRDTAPEKRLLIIRRWAMLPAALLAIAATGISGCSSTPVDNTASLAEIRPENSAQLQAVRQMIDAGEFGNARVQLQQLDMTDFSPTGRAEWHLLTSESFLGLGDTETAGRQLTAYEHYLDYTSDEQQYRAALLGARIMEAQGQFFEAARERDFVSAVISDDLKQANYNRLWLDLMQMPAETLLSQAETASATRFGAWLTLAAISRRHDLTIDEQLAGVKDWQLLHPGHPASENLPGALAMLEDIAASRPERVALLLPLTGPLARTGEAIRDGFMAAYYTSLQKGFPVPAITIIDQSQNESIDQGYAEAIQAGSQWLVGPLTKNDVQTLEERASLPLPTLALNYGSRDGSAYAPLPAELFEFGLSAEDEAVQIADQAWKDGHRRALVMIPEGSWGARIYQAFEEHWLELGGEIEEVRQYPKVKDYNPDISALLNVDSSKNRYKTVRSLMREPVEFEPRRRQDADWMFLVALPEQARQIKPTLAFNFARDLPVYATSHVFSGEINTRADRDLNGIYFCDAPWLLRPSEVKLAVDDATGGQGGFARLYALGADAFRLVARVKQLQAFPDSSIYGSTGALTLDEQRRIHRHTDCTRFSGGAPVQLAKDE